MPQFGLVQPVAIVGLGRNWANETLLAVMKAHIITEVTYYRGQCYTWDVVNETLNDDGTFRTDVFYNTIGEAYIQIAFETAAAADLSKLYYNDYNIGTAGTKATAALNIREDDTGRWSEDRWCWVPGPFHCRVLAF
jgi:GH35 family endo-1,4-beta-xylanase